MLFVGVVVVCGGGGGMVHIQAEVKVHGRRKMVLIEVALN